METSHMLDLWQKLLSDSCTALRDEAALADPADVRAVAALRKHHPAELVAIALDLASARRKARSKFPAIAHTIVADSVGMEQATSHLVAEHKAKRFRDLPGVVDLCCGIGGDAMSLPVSLAIDRDPLRAWMTSLNAHCPTAVMDVKDWQDKGQTYHIDPSRRDGSQRKHAFADYQPGPEYLDDLMARCPDGAIKLGPGIPPDLFGDRGELEFICEHGSLVQAVLWTGKLRHDALRTATLLPENVSLSGEPGEPQIEPPSRYLLEVNSALERAGLMGLLDLPAIHPALGLLTSDQPVTSPWLTAFELIEHMPWRAKKVKQWLHAHDAGIVEIKTRGRAIDPDDVQRDLRGQGAEPYTLFILRFDRQVEALIARRHIDRTTPAAPRADCLDDARKER